MASTQVSQNEGVPCEKTLATDGGRLQIHLNIPRRLYTLPFFSFVLGTMIGVQRGSRVASMRFLAENAHRPPKTVRGWHFYHKTKNYRVMWGAVKEGSRIGTRLGLIALGWAGAEEGLGRVGGVAEEGREVGAGIVTAAVFCLIYRVTGRDAGRVMGLGLGGGIATWGMRVFADRVARAQEKKRRESRVGG